MNFDAHLGAVTRTVTVLEKDGKPARGVTLERTFATSVADLWDALTNPERLPRWFLPVSGDLRPGGRYQLEGNATGTISACEPPHLLDLSWEFAGETSWVEVRVSPAEGGRSRLTLSHIALLDEHYWPSYGPGAGGVGWDLALAALDAFLVAPAAPRFDESLLSTTPEGRQFVASLSEDWGRAAIAGGEDPAWARSAAARTTAFYMGEESQGE